MHEKLNYGLALIAMASLTALLVYHARVGSVALPNAPPPVGVAPGTDAAFANTPSYLTYNLPPYGVADTSWLPNAASPAAPTGGVNANASVL